MTIQHLKRPAKPTLAYAHTPGQGHLPPVMFLGGYRSDMTGTKALFLEAQCTARGQEFLRFDYSGHGMSEGDFSDGTIGSWAQDALEMFDAVLNKPAVIVGSSMGGWMALLLALARTEKIRALIGIAAAPDFTEELYGRMNAAQQKRFHAQGFFDIPGDYSPEPYHFTKSFYDEARQHCLLNREHAVPFAVTLLQGKQDKDVPWRTAEKIAARFQGPDTKTIYIDDGDHRLSRTQDLLVLDETVLASSACI